MFFELFTDLVASVVLSGLLLREFTLTNDRMILSLGIFTSVEAYRLGGLMCLLFFFVIEILFFYYFLLGVYIPNFNPRRGRWYSHSQ